MSWMATTKNTENEKEFTYGLIECGVNFAPVLFIFLFSPVPPPNSSIITHAN